MPRVEHRFAFRWRIPGEPAEVFDLLAEPARYPEWWGSVHAAARAVAPGEAGASRAVELLSGARLPLLLRTRVSVMRLEPPRAIAFRLGGRIEGDGAWRLDVDGPYVSAALECRLRATRLPAALLLPLVRAEWRWAMRQGEIGLRLELRRRHAATAHERAMVPRLAGVAVRGRLADASRGAFDAPLLSSEPGGPTN